MGVYNELCNTVLMLIRYLTSKQCEDLKMGGVTHFSFYSNLI